MFDFLHYGATFSVWQSRIIHGAVQRVELRAGYYKVPLSCHLFIQVCITEKILEQKPSLYVGQRICKDVDSLL